jgi:hypothetical protein
MASLQQAQEEAARSRRPVAAYFSYEGCHWCDELRKNTFPDRDVIERSKAFTWVAFDRDRHREAIRPFNILAYPSVLVLGPDGENIHRFEGYRTPDEMLDELDEALRRYGLFQEGKDWVDPPTRPPQVLRGATAEKIPLPMLEVGRGVAFVGKEMFVVQGINLHRFDAQSGKWLQSYPIPDGIHDLCSDGTLIYALSWGWSKGDPIYVFDPANGSTVMEIVTESNKENKQLSAEGIEWFKSELYVLADRGVVYIVDPGTGKVRLSLKTPRHTYGLAFDGENFATVDRTGVHMFSPSGKPGPSIETNYPLGSIGFKDGIWYLLESEVYGFDRNHKRVRVWPKEAVIHKVALPK